MRAAGRTWPAAPATRQVAPVAPPTGLPRLFARPSPAAFTSDLPGHAER